MYALPLTLCPGGAHAPQSEQSTADEVDEPDDEVAESPAKADGRLLLALALALASYMCGVGK